MFVVHLLMASMGSSHGGEGDYPRMVIEGQIDVAQYFPSNRTDQIRYTMYLDGCKVLITSTPTTNSKADPYTAYREYRFDGTNSMEKEKIFDDAVFPMNARHTVLSNDFLIPTAPKGKKPKLASPRNKGNVDIHLGNRPSLKGAMSIVCLAYAPGCYFADKSSGETVATSDFFMISNLRRADEISDRAFWKWSGEERHYLESLFFLREDRKYQGFAWYRGEETNVIYRTTAWTNFEGTPLPLEFEYRMLFKNPKAPEEPPATMSKFVGRTTSVRPLTDPLDASLPARLTNAVRILDFRDSDGAGEVGGEPIIYFADDGKLKSLEEARAYALEKENAPRRIRPVVATVKPNEGNVKWIFVLLVGVGAVVVSGAFWLLSLRDRHGKPAGKNQN